MYAERLTANAYDRSPYARFSESRRQELAQSPLQIIANNNTDNSNENTENKIADQPLKIISQKKNAKGGFIPTVIDTFISYTLMPAPIVKLFKSLGEKILRINPKDEKQSGMNLAAELGLGTTGFFIAEEAVRRFIDPACDKVAHILNSTIENKLPKFGIQINESADHLINKGLHIFLGLFNKKLDTDKIEAPSLSAELQEKLEHYARNRSEIDKTDEMHFPNLVKELLHYDYEKLYGKRMPNLLSKTLDLSFHFVSIKSPTRLLLSANGVAEALKENIFKFLPKPVAESIYELLYNGLPNLYSLIGRPIAIFAINHKMKEVQDLVNKLEIEERG